MKPASGPSRLDSAASYTDIVNSDNNGNVVRGPSAFNVTEEADPPITSTVISNVRGRSIIAGSGKEVILTFNGGSGSQQEYDHLAAVQTDGTEESTHRISNEKLDDSPEKANAKDKEPIKNSALCISSNAKNVHDRR